MQVTFHWGGIGSAIGRTRCTPRWGVALTLRSCGAEHFISGGERLDYDAGADRRERG